MNEQDSKIREAGAKKLKMPENGTATTTNNVPTTEADDIKNLQAAKPAEECVSVQKVESVLSVHECGLSNAILHVLRSKHHEVLKLDGYCCLSQSRLGISINLCLGAF